MSDGGEHPGHAAQRPRGAELRKLTLAALGVVYGDIGTSPLYALRECFHGESGVAPTPENVLGVLSLVFWALTLVIAVKYLSFVMRADNEGEGGILALLALAERRSATGASGLRVALLLALGGASLLYGESMITPAISVLSAIEGLEVRMPLPGGTVDWRRRTLIIYRLSQEKELPPHAADHCPGQHYRADHRCRGGQSF